MLEVRRDDSGCGEGTGWYLGLTQRAFQGQSAESTSAIIERANKIWRHGITMCVTRPRIRRRNRVETRPGYGVENLIDRLYQFIISRKGKLLFPAIDYRSPFFLTSSERATWSGRGDRRREGKSEFRLRDSSSKRDVTIR